MRGRIRWKMLVLMFLVCVILLIYGAGIGMWSVQCEPRGQCQFSVENAVNALAPASWFEEFRLEFCSSDPSPYLLRSC